MDELQTAVVGRESCLACRIVDALIFLKLSWRSIIGQGLLLSTHHLEGSPEHPDRGKNIS
jgi:hypothetical protein